GVHGRGLIAFGLEFEGLTVVDRGGVDEVGDIGPQRLGDRGQERDRSFSLAVLDRRDLRGRTPTSCPSSFRVRPRCLRKNRILLPMLRVSVCCSPLSTSASMLTKAAPIGS